MAVLTAEFPPTSGDATLAGYSVTREPEKTRRRVGYCPQFDAHFSNLTGREHVELYASVKGVPPSLVKEAASLKLDEVGLDERDRDRLASGYSGGMKRRLSLATATIGNPQIVFLDECSTGGKFLVEILKLQKVPLKVSNCFRFSSRPCCST
jgi:ATP-binding cassette subfamily A (ABC1) protein 1